jgi:hypothetical protein
LVLFCCGCKNNIDWSRRRKTKNSSRGVINIPKSPRPGTVDLFVCSSE